MGFRRVERDAPRLSQANGSRLIIPVLNVRAADLTDTYSDAGDDGERLHEAIDITTPAGTGVVTSGPSYDRAAVLFGGARQHDLRALR